MRRTSLLVTGMAFSLTASLPALAASPVVDPAKEQATVKKNGKAASKAKNGGDKDKSSNAGEHIHVVGHMPSTVASSATKTNTPLIETPASVTVITRNEMDRRGVTTLNQAVRYTAGVTPDLRGSTATRYDLFDLRGFNVPIYLDGLRLQNSPTGYASFQTDTSRMDRIEILKGPASALYGQSSPGGLVAISSKLPTAAKSYGSLLAQGGSFDMYRIDGDTGGWLTDDGMVRYRIYGTANGSHSQLSKTGSKRFSISPSVTFGGDSKTHLTLLGNYQYDPESGAYGSVPALGSYMKAPFGKIPRDYYDGDKSFETFNRKQAAITYILDHKFNDNWQFTTRGRYDNISTSYRSVYTTGMYFDDNYVRHPDLEEQGQFSRGSIAARENMSNLAFDSQFKGHENTGPVRHNLMFGFDYQKSVASEDAWYGTAPPMSILSPNPHQGIPPMAATPSVSYFTNQQQLGAYGQDEMQWGRLHVTGSIRNDWYDSWQREAIGGTTSRQNASQITFRAGGIYHFDFGLAPYISYSTSFQPQSGPVSNDGGRTIRQANPSLGKQLEGGLKYQLPGTSLFLSATGFHLEQTKVLVSVPNTSYSTESGLVHSDGFEFEAHAEAFRNMMITAAYSIQRVHDDSTGKPLIQSGKGNASLFAYYTVPDGPLKGLGFGGGLRYTAKSYGGPSQWGDINVPSYVLFDGSLGYDLGNLSSSMKNWHFDASVRNLFDKSYVASCYGYAGYDQWCWYGARRNAQGSISYHW